MNFQNPSLLLAGLALVAVPLVIHLLNRRRIKVVDWAAMDFLLEAQQKNRRRVLLENLLLLLLRCLAVALLAMVVGRPLLNSALAGRWSEAAPLERMVIFDDSLSMQSAAGTTSTFELARDRLVELCRQWSAEPSASVLTLRVTSRPTDPVLQGGRLSPERIEEIVDVVRRIEPTDLTAELSQALEALDRDLDGAGSAPRLVYLVSDLRRRDWSLDASESPRDDSDGAPAGDGVEKSANATARDSASQTPALEILAKLARRTNGAVVLDVGGTEDGNLVITSMEAEGILAVDVPSRLTVQVWNPGSAVARDLEVKFTAGDSLPLVESLEQLAPGETASVSFTVTFPATLLGEDARETIVPVRAEVTSSRPGSDDRLTTDSAASLAARVRRGIPVLVVDGDPSADYGKSESFYLTRALAPPGSIPSGIAPEVVTSAEFEGKSLDPYQVVFLCNVSAVDEARRESLEAWVRAGGGVVIFPGDAIDEGTYNAVWHRAGAGLSPVALAGIRGDETEQRWTTLRVDAGRDSFLSLLAGDDNPLLQRVKTFRWWGATGSATSGANVLATWTDVDATPAVVERTFGEGRVVWFAGPADADWSNWSSDPSFLIVTQELTRTLARAREPSTGIRVGQPLRVPVDLAEFKPEATLRTPRDERLHLVAGELTNSSAPTGSAGKQTPTDGAPSRGSGASNEGPPNPDVSRRTVWHFEYAATLQQGFYELQLERDGEPAPRVVITASVDPSEGNLRRADVDQLRRELGDAPVTFVDAANPATTRSGGQQAEIWWYLAWGLAGILGTEQLLAWRFGRDR